MTNLGELSSFIYTTKKSDLIEEIVPCLDVLVIFPALKMIWFSAAKNYDNIYHPDNTLIVDEATKKSL